MFLMVLVSIVISKHLQSVPEFFTSLVKESCFRSNRQHSVLLFPASKKNIITPSVAHFTTCNFNERKGRKDAPHKNSKYNFEREFRSECTSAICYLAYPCTGILDSNVAVCFDIVIFYCLFYIS